MIRQVVCALAVSFTALSALHAQDRTAQPTGATFDANKSVLTLRYAEGRQRDVKLEPASRRYQHFRIGGEMLRYYSPAYYAKLGAEPIGRVIFTQARSLKDIHFDTVNAVARKFPLARTLTADDLGMLATIALIRRHNHVGRRPLCRQEKVAELMPGILAESCYVVCGGLSAIVSQTSLRPSRVVSLEARIDQLQDKHEFHWSEGHTLVEIEGDAGWYAADPTFGFVYVKDASGARLSVQGLLQALGRDPSGKDLSFGLVYRDSIRDVPGTPMLTASPVISSVYFTPDKKIKLYDPAHPVVSAE